MAVGAAAAPAQASFHFMQIEQVIGGVNGDVSAQAIQLRMRSPSQRFVSQARIRAWDATGSNPVLILDFAQDVANGQIGDRVLVVSSNFDQTTDPPVVPDFLMTNPIPPSYLAAGSLTFESDTGLVYWRLSWGGAAYTGRIPEALRMMQMATSVRHSPGLYLPKLCKLWGSRVRPRL
jgi:hypothetical protein